MVRTLVDEWFPVDGEWHHVCLKEDLFGGKHRYVDGVLVMNPPKEPPKETL